MAVKNKVIPSFLHLGKGEAVEVAIAIGGTGGRRRSIRRATAVKIRRRGCGGGVQRNPGGDAKASAAAVKADGGGGAAGDGGSGRAAVAGRGDRCRYRSDVDDEKMVKCRGKRWCSRRETSKRNRKHYGLSNI